MNRIIWSDLAFLTYTSISEYLQKFSLDAALNFDAEVESLLDKLKSFKNLCPPHQKLTELRKCTVNKYTFLLVRVDGNDIHLVTFHDSRRIELI